MKHIFCILFYLSLVYTSIGQKASMMLVPFEHDGQWGYMNYNKEIVVSPKFDEAFPTYGLLGRVRKNGKYGFINTKGEVIVPLKYDFASDFKDGYVVVEKNGKKKHLNSAGKVNKVYPSRCGAGPAALHLDIPMPFVFKGQNGKYGLLVKKIVVNEDRTIRFEPDTIHPIFDTVVSLGIRSMYVLKDGKIAFTHSSNFSDGSKAILEQMDFDYDEIKYFSVHDTDEIHPILGIKQHNVWGFFDVFRGIAGMEIVKPKYHSISSMENRYALVEYTPGKFGYIDYEGNEYFWRQPHHE